MIVATYMLLIDLLNDGIKKALRCSSVHCFNMFLGVIGQNIPGQNLPDKIYPDKIYLKKHSQTKYFRIKYTQTKKPGKISLNIRLFKVALYVMLISIERLSTIGLCHTSLVACIILLAQNIYK